MKPINLPPFYVGQRVVALETSAKRDGCQVIKGNVYTVAGNFQCPKCGTWSIDIMEILVPWHDRLKRCCINISYAKYMAGWAKKFAPIAENFQPISYEKVMEEESKLISVN